MNAIQLLLSQTLLLTTLTVPAALLAPRGKRLHTLAGLAAIAALGATLYPVATAAAGALWTGWIVLNLLLLIQGTRRAALRARATRRGWRPKKAHRLPR